MPENVFVLSARSSKAPGFTTTGLVTNTSVRPRSADETQANAVERLLRVESATIVDHALRTVREELAPDHASTSGGFGDPVAAAEGVREIGARRGEVVLPRRIDRRVLVGRRGVLELHERAQVEPSCTSTSSNSRSKQIAAVARVPIFVEEMLVLEPLVEAERQIIVRIGTERDALQRIERIDPICRIAQELPVLVVG